MGTRKFRGGAEKGTGASRFKIPESPGGDPRIALLYPPAGEDLRDKAEREVAHPGGTLQRVKPAVPFLRPARAFPSFLPHAAENWNDEDSRPQKSLTANR